MADGIYAATGGNVTITHSGDITSTGGRGIYAYAFDTPSFYVKPLVDVDAIGLWRGA